MASQIIALSLMLIGLMVNSYLHGKEKTGKHNVFVDIIAKFITLWILYSGGFFDVFFK